MNMGQQLLNVVRRARPSLPVHTCQEMAVASCFVNPPEQRFVDPPGQIADMLIPTITLLPLPLPLAEMPSPPPPLPTSFSLLQPHPNLVPFLHPYSFPFQSYLPEQDQHLIWDQLRQSQRNNANSILSMNHRLWTNPRTNRRLHHIFQLHPPKVFRLAKGVLNTETDWIKDSLFHWQDPDIFKWFFIQHKFLRLLVFLQQWFFNHWIICFSAVTLWFSINLPINRS